MRGATPIDSDSISTIQISIHTPHAGSDLLVDSTLCNQVIFQSTLPMRGATKIWIDTCSALLDFNPHSPCGERHNYKVSYTHKKSFQSTLPMRGATSTSRFMFPVIVAFQSTLPMRGATVMVPQDFDVLTDFNPHSPCGERR